MSTPDKPVIDPRFRAGDKYREAITGLTLTRDAVGRWITDWGLWTLSDHHLTEFGARQDADGYWRPLS
jgi:hypothetical protein